MLRQVAKNRWFLWALVAIIITGLILWWQIQKDAIDADTVAATDQIISLNKKPPTQNDLETNDNYGTSKWKTYRNEKYGFEFKYPEKYLPNPPDSKDVLLFKSGEGAQTWDIRIHWNVWNSGVKSINELTSLKNSALIEVGSEDALKLSSGKESTQAGYIFIHGGREYDFEINTVNSKIMNDADQILSTLKFFEPKGQ